MTAGSSSALEAAPITCLLLPPLLLRAPLSALQQQLVQQQLGLHLPPALKGRSSLPGRSQAVQGLEQQPQRQQTLQAAS